MSIRNTNDPYGSPNVFVDEIIGTAYKAVKFVADRMSLIKTVAENMSKIAAAANSIGRYISTLEGSVTAGTPDDILLPTEIIFGDIIDSQVVIEGSDGSLYSETPANFSSLVHAEYGLVIVFAGSAPSVILNGATIHWSISYKA